MRTSTMRSIAAVTAAAALLGVSVPGALAADKLKFSYLMHDKPEGVFWNIVYRGMLDACADLDLDCQMIGSDYDSAKHLANFQATVAAGVDGIVTRQSSTTRSSTSRSRMPSTRESR